MNLEIHDQSGLYCTSELCILLEYPPFSTSCCASPQHQNVDIGNACHNCIRFQTCSKRIREVVDNHMTIYCISLPIHKEFAFFCQDSVLGCTGTVHQSVLSLLVQRRMLVLHPFILAHGFPWLVPSSSASKCRYWQLLP